MKLRAGIVAAAITAVSLAAHAHAFLDHADPKVGSTVAAPPGAARLWFTEPLEPAFSSIAVLDANGHRVDAGQPQPDAHDPLLLQVPLTRLAPGEYTVVWRAVSVDTHVTQGRFTFRVAP
jgi:copper resistance protein C